MLISDPKNLDFTAHTRLFVIGCSFTKWLWPTWADIIAKEYPHLVYYNFGTGGCGNDYIFTMLSQITKEYNIGEGDIVLIMWSSFNRISYYNTYEDSERLQEAIINDDARKTDKKDIRYSTWCWNSSPDLVGAQALENPYTNCDRGFLLRDLAIIDTVATVMEQSAYTGAYMLSVAPDEQDIFDTTTPKTYNEDALEFYKEVEEKQLGNRSLYNYLDYKQNNIVWDYPGPKVDYHPYSIQYYAFLRNVGIRLSKRVKEYCIFCDKIIDETTDSQYLISSKDWPYDFRSHEKFPL